MTQTKDSDESIKDFLGLLDGMFDAKQNELELATNTNLLRAKAEEGDVGIFAQVGNIRIMWMDCEQCRNPFLN
jgi:hypothetical protein